MRQLVAALCFCLTACASAPKGSTAPELPPAAPGTLTVGRTASTNDSAVQDQADAFAELVKQATGQPVRPAVFPDYDGLAKALATGTVDVAFLAPLAYVRAEGQGRVKPLLRVLRNGRPSYRAVLFASPSSGLTTLEELAQAKNLKAAWVDSSSATGYIFPKARLLVSGVDPAGVFMAQDFYGTHDAVCRAVHEGKADVGATFTDDPAEGAVRVTGCEAALGEAASGLKIIGATDELPNDVVAARPELPAELETKLVTALQGLQSSEEGKQRLVKAFLAEGFTSITSDDYAPVRAALDAFKE